MLLLLRDAPPTIFKPKILLLLDNEDVDEDGFILEDGGIILDIHPFAYLELR